MGHRANFDDRLRLRHFFIVGERFLRRRTQFVARRMLRFMLDGGRQLTYAVAAKFARQASGS